MSKKVSTGLGKGLGALLPTTIEFSEKGFKFKSLVEEDSQEKFALIDIAKIGHNPYQPRKDFDPQALEELKNSILEHGVIQPVTVRRTPTGYEIISGERRLRATQSAGLTKIPAYILEDVSDIKMLEMALIENIQRENLNPIEIANGYNRLIEECNFTQEEVASRVGKDRTTVTNFLRLLKLPEIIQESLRNREIMMGHAKALLALSSQKKILNAWKFINQNHLSVRETENLVKNFEAGILDDNFNKKDGKKNKSNTEVKSNVSHETSVVIEDLENSLRQKFGTKVKISPKDENSGNITFEFYSKDEFERLIEMFESAG